VSVLNRLFTEALSWGLVVESSMGSPEIVVVEVTREAVGALAGGWVGSFVGPLAKQGLDEAFGLSVGFGSIGPGAEMAELESLAGGLELVGDVAGAVVGHDGLDMDAAVVEPTERASEEAGGGRRSLIGEDLGVGHSSGVVDGDMDELPTDAAGLDRVISMDTVADPADAAQLLDIDMDQLARPLLLVANDGFFELEAL
jgi:hypothetical protein